MKQRGDTIVEVLLAITVFSLIAVGGLAIMNQGTAMAQRSLEIGLVRDQMDSQADALRYLHDAYLMNFSETEASPTTTLWQDAILKHAVSEAQDFDAIGGVATCNIPTSGTAATSLPYGVTSDGLPFALDIQKLDPDTGNPSMTSIQAADTYAQIRYPSPQAQGIWIQPVYSPPSGSTTVGYIDFHIRACWLTPGQAAPMTLGTIVRLYEPKHS